MAVFNNGSITATVTPPQGYSGSYSYELLKYDNGSWVTVTAAAEGYNANLFINPISTSATTYTFGNPDGFDDNIEGSSTWRGLKPAQYKVVVTTLTGLTCEVEGTATVGSDDPTDPCYGFNISASVDSDTAITVTVVGGTASFTWTLNGSGAAAFDNGDGTFTFNNLTPSTFYTIGVVDANLCTNSVTATTTGTVDPEFTCTDANFQVADGTTGQDVVATVAAGTLNSVSPAQYVDGPATYTANITVPATGYSNSGATLTTCTDTATGSTVLPEFTCTDANFQVADGTTNQDVVATVAAGTLNSVSPAQYVEGSATYTANITVPATGYSNSGATLTTCTDTATGSTVLPEFTCTDANFQVADGTTGQDVVATVAVGTLNSVSPAQYVDGPATYTANITVPATGYSNSGATLTTCTDTATGSAGGGGTDERTWYYFHGYDTNTINISGGYLTSPSDGNYYLSVNGAYQGFVSTLTEAFQHILDNQGSAPNGMSIDSFEMNESITGNGGATTWTYQATASPQSYYLAVPDNALFTENLTQGDYISFPYPTNPPQDLPEVADLQINGVNYKLYLLPGQTEAASLTAGLA